MTTAVAPTGAAPPATRSGKTDPKRKGIRSPYPTWFYIPAAVLFIVFFAVPTFASFYFSLTRWTLFDVQFIGFDNFVQFFQEPQLVQGFINTFIYGFVTSAAKVVLGLALALLLTGPILGRGYLRAVVFFPVLVSTIGVGLTFKALLDPFHGVVNNILGFFNLPEPGWYTDPNLALLTVAGVDIWKGVGIATLIFMAGIVAIPHEYFEAARMDGAGAWSIFRNITLPLVRPATATVIILSLIGGLREFAMIWAMTKGGPGFSSDVIASVIYKQYQAGFFGLSTAGNVILFLVVTAVMVPVSWLLNRREAEL
ncbi:MULTISPECIES: carbohydrate ABC transporter permease [Microbacterium]|uniref:carbohydrate ABC transporter permease n=1 Tax=Microbacterium TaxID=33882 RepID=UPI0006FB07A1|nr:MULTISPECIES: sugar ABC transporter permease [Microbacterium]KQP68547.1 ABC transporter [Microbacterium sp. Leaf288]MDR7113123.1 raffinose/stachyose/melibiose transport system permease protein [Microbacterium trichothecenolyticum]MDT0143369.1 sugar ABC transporter permease [Microbacterium sp. PRC9]